MKLWLSKSTEVPLQEQLSAQIVLGIVSADLSPGERLPSSVQVARRFHIHPNTVRLAYRGLAREGWLEWKPGNGFFVRDPSRECNTESANAEQLIATLFDAASRMGVSAREIRSRLNRWLAVKPPDRIVVIEPDPELRKILVSEIQDSVESRVHGIGPEQLRRLQFRDALLAGLHDRPERAGMQNRPLEKPFVRLKSNSISEALTRERQPPPDMIISVMSRWSGFLERARATLTAVGFDPARLELRKGGLSDAKRRLAAGNLVVADSLMGRQLPAHPRLRVFRIISNESLAELKKSLRK